jgi:acetyl esterase/lipase
MNKTSFTYFYHFRYFSAHAQFSLHLFDKSAKQIAANYKVLKNISYGPIKSKIYISKDAKKLSDKNFTVIFLHGGGYYLSDKSKEEKYIQLLR